MEPSQTDKWKENVKYIIQQITKQQISELLTSTFELEDMPEIIAVNRGITSIKGFTKISKKVFQFALIFLEQDNKLEMIVDLYFGKHALVKTKEILLKEDEAGIEVYLKENMQFLFAVYF